MAEDQTYIDLDPKSLAKLQYLEAKEHKKNLQKKKKIELKAQASEKKLESKKKRDIELWSMLSKASELPQDDHKELPD
jgi:hypothetical protein